jgi:amidase
MTAGAALSAVALAAAVRSGQRSATDEVTMCLRRIDERNPALNAVIYRRDAGARADAQRIDRDIAEGRDPGPLAGVPFTVKDVIATRDLPTTCGSRALLGQRTAFDATAVHRLRAAGAILIGKTNTPEFAFNVDTVNAAYGRTNNPLGPFTPGGSSGGESASVASGVSHLGIGTDFGGSIRWPAQCTGLVGLRPTVGRVPGSGQLPGLSAGELCAPQSSSLQGAVQVIGPIGRSVDDVEAALRVIWGPDGLDAAAIDVPLGDSAAVRPDDLEIRWGTVIAGFDVDREVAEGVAAAVTVLEKAGARTAHGLPSCLDAAADVYTRLRAADPLTEMRRAVSGREELLEPGTRELLARTPAMPAEGISELWRLRAELIDDLAGWLHGNRILALPVAVVPPFDTAAGPAKGDREGRPRFDLVTPSRVISLFGLPAISVPCGTSRHGKPLAVQLVAAAFREDLVLAAARLIEQAARQ